MAMYIKNLSLSFGTEEIFDDVTLKIPDGNKVGVVGVNGAGKTTFFKLILGLEESDHGTIEFDNKKRISYLPQIITDEIPSTDITVFDFLLSARPIVKLQKEIENKYIEMANADNVRYNKLAKEIDKLQAELDYWEPFTSENTLLKLISDMLDDEDILNKKLKELSGGQKSKVAFVRLLYSKPEVLLLDEPTNHLDDKTKKFVMNYLKNYQGSIYVISHDAEFLDAICDKTLLIDKKHHNMRLFNGNYSNFQRIQKEEEERTLKLFKKQEREKEKLEKIIAKYIHGNEKKARIAKDREKKLARLEENSVTVEKKMKTVNISLHQGRESNKFPLIIRNLCFRYDKSDKRDIIHNLNLEIPRGEKFLIVGENGVGKSTLLKLIISELKPDRGEIILSSKTDIAYYAQEHEQLEEDKTLIENLKEFNLTSKQEIAYLGRFLFYGDDLDKKVKVLSPGERSRLALLKLTLKNANLLILDEPTNHLDPETQQIMAKNLKDFKGTIILVSHNPSFVDYLGVNRTLVLPEGRLSYYEKDIVEKYYKLNNKKRN